MRGSSLLAFPLLLAACFGQNGSEYTPPPEAYHSPRSFTDVVQSTHPQDFYTEAYGAFRFSSQSLLTLTKADSAKTFSGTSAFEIDENGGYHLIRTPLSGEPTVEVYKVGPKVYLKSGGETKFRLLRPQPEFTHWIAMSLREVFSLYDQAGFGKESATAAKGSLSCWTQESNSLCFDPGSGLPVEGTLKVSQAKGSVLSVSFKIVPAKPENLKVAPPA